MLKVGLTGSIAVGKSFVCDVFRELGVPVLDADLTARTVVEPRTDGYVLLVEAFGTDILQRDGQIDRSVLSSIIFADESKRKLLNSIVHPLVIADQNKWIEAREREVPDGIAIVDAALMIESGGYKRFGKLIVVWCESKLQLDRLMKRDDLTAEEASRRIAAQLPQEEKKRFADYLIDTTTGTDETRRQTIDVFERLKASRGK